MLRIRFTRTGKKGQPSFRIVVAEKSAPIKGKHIDIVGYYMIANKDKKVVLDKEKIQKWISVGALPTDTVASLLKREGMANMEKYIGPRHFKRKKKGAEEAPAAPAASAAKPAEAPAPAQA